MTTAEVARVLGVTPHTMRVWRVKGTGPDYIKMGDAKQARVRYDRATVEQWRERHIRRVYTNDTQVNTEATV